MRLLPDTIRRISSTIEMSLQQHLGYDNAVSIRCVQDPEKTGSIPVIQTKAIDSITNATALSGIVVSNDGGSEITSWGVCWNTNQNPTIYHNLTIQIKELGNLTTKITGLIPGTKYYVRGYALNSSGIAYGNELVFTAGENDFGEFTDKRDGKSYKTVIIDNQVWMAENLGWLPSVSSPSMGSAQIAHYYVYGYQGTAVAQAIQSYNYSKYGALYNMAAAKTACPSGWRLPSDTDWMELEKALGMSALEAGLYSYRGSKEGKKIKSKTGWNIKGYEGDDNYGFNAVPAGKRLKFENKFDYQGRFTQWWSSTKSSGYYTLNRVVGEYEWQIYRGTDDNETGQSVRCLKNNTAQGLKANVRTIKASSITSSSALAEGEVIDQGGSNVEKRGVCWNKTGKPIVSDSKTSDGSGTGIFNSNMTGLSPNTTYYIRSYAINAEGTSYGEEIVIQTAGAN
jgi:uncharacterized protein (TIGR02145 family)